MFLIKKQALSKMLFYQHSTISLYSWFLLVLSCNIFLMTFHGFIFLNIKLGPITTSSPRRRGRGLHNPDSSHDQIRCFWLAEVRNFTNIMIELFTKAQSQLSSTYSSLCEVRYNKHKSYKAGNWVEIISWRFKLRFRGNYFALSPQVHYMRNFLTDTTAQNINICE